MAHGRLRMAASGRGVFLAFLALSVGPGCSEAPVEVGVPRMVAACEREGVRLNQNPATRDERVGEYILTCMRAKGYGVSFKNTV